MKQHIVLVTPALAEANNGNWQTARRWQQLLQPHYQVRIVAHWPDGPLAARDDCMLALHARRSADSIAAWASAHAQAGAATALAVVLTGTDLYRDIQNDAQAQQSLRLAQRLVLLQERGVDALPEAMRNKATVIFQSTRARQTLPKTNRHLRAVMVGHLRDEKSPQTLFAAARLLAPEDGIQIDHIGAALEPALGAMAQATAQECSHYRWLGALAHDRTRRRIQQAHVMVHTSRMEGGAHVVLEAVCAGTPVLASRIAGNVGMLGADYAGYFDWNDAAQLATLLRRCRNRATDPLYAQLQDQCRARAPLFAPQAEQAALRRLVAQLLDTPVHAVARLRSARLARSAKPFLARGGQHGERCAGCRLVPSHCLCALRPLVPTRAGVCLLMADIEPLKPSNTGWLIADVVPDTFAFGWARTVVDPALLALLADPQWQPYVVFPGEFVDPARVVTQLSTLHGRAQFPAGPPQGEFAPLGGSDPRSSTNRGRPLFVLLDATWPEARKMFRKSPYLNHLPVLSLQSEQLSRYRLRRSTRDDHFCTSEVAALCLELAGEPQAAQTLEAYLDVFTHHYLQAKRQLPVDRESAAHQRLAQLALGA